MCRVDSNDEMMQIGASEAEEEKGKDGTDKDVESNDGEVVGGTTQSS